MVQWTPLPPLLLPFIVINASKQHGAKNQSEVALFDLQIWYHCNHICLRLFTFFVSRIGATSQSLFTLTNGQFTFNGAAIDGGNV